MRFIRSYSVRWTIPLSNVTCWEIRKESVYFFMHFLLLEQKITKLYSKQFKKRIQIFVLSLFQTWAVNQDGANWIVGQPFCSPQSQAVL